MKLALNQCVRRRFGRMVLRKQYAEGELDVTKL